MVIRARTEMPFFGLNTNIECAILAIFGEAAQGTPATLTVSLVM